MQHAFCILFLFAATTVAAETPAEFLPLAKPRPHWRIPLIGHKPNDPGAAGGKDKVQWRPWGADAFAEAARKKKPIFLFISANWCHAGKVMERTTFSDGEVASLIASDFIPIQLDRDKRPDVDVRMQQAVQALGGTRGWPLCVCLTPDGKPYFGGTYFPLDDEVAAERPGMRSVLHFLVSLWLNQQEEVQRQAAALLDTLAAPDENETRGELSADYLNHAAEKMQELMDWKGGGLMPVPERYAPKFPAPRALDLALTHFARTGDRKSLLIALGTLDAMLRGGIYDHIEGGFHRFCADRWWRQPRFEKQLAPNAEMLPVLLHAWQVSGDERYREALERTLDFWSRMSDPAGGFFSSQAPSATSLEDGEYFTWSVREIEDGLRDDGDCAFAKAYFGVDETGNLPLTAPGRCVLYEAMSPAEAARAANVPAGDANERLARVTKLLAEARLRRDSPHVDRTLYVDGSALMAAAFIECGRALEQPRYLDLGLKTLRRLIKEGVYRSADGNGAALHFLGENPQTSRAELAEDEAALAYACTCGFEATGEKDFAEEAEACLRRVFHNNWDAQASGYYDRSSAERAEPAGKKDWRLKVFQDTSEPSANGLVALTCTRMYALTGRKEFLARAASIVEAFGAAMESAGPYGATLGRAADEIQRGATIVVVGGKPADGKTRELLLSALRTFAPAKIVVNFPLSENAAEDGSALFIGSGAKQAARDGAFLQKLLKSY